MSYSNPTGSYAIRAGSNFTTIGGQFVTASSITIHPEYNTNLIDKDVAVIKLSAALTFNSNVQVIPLAEPDSEPSLQVLGIVSGWGTIKVSFFLQRKRQIFETLETFLI